MTSGFQAGHFVPHHIAGPDIIQYQYTIHERWKGLGVVFEKLIAYVRILLGLVYAINGLNWFFKVITPYPSMSDFVDYMPPPDIVGALIENGILFHMAKAVELATGLLLLCNRGVPLALVLSMTVTVPVFVVDVFKPEFRLRAFLMGTGSLTMNITLLVAYYHYLRPMLNWRTAPSTRPGEEAVPKCDGLAQGAGGIGQLLLPVLMVPSVVIGTVICGWLLVMMAQYVADPKAIHEVRDMVPRAAAHEPG